MLKLRRKDKNVEERKEEGVIKRMRKVWVPLGLRAPTVSTKTNGRSS